jgi:hypothetical protein
MDELNNLLIQNQNSDLYTVLEIYKMTRRMTRTSRVD